MKINKFNYQEIYPQASMRFSTIVDGRFAPTKYMYVGNTQARYLEPNDIIKIMQRRLKAPQSKQKDLNQHRWLKMIELSQKIIAKEENDNAA